MATGGAVLLLAAVALALYTWRTTGEVFRMPYQVYEETYATAPVFVFGSLRPSPSDVPADLAAVHDGIALLLRDDVPWPRAAFDNLVVRAPEVLRFQLGPLLAVAALVGAVVACRRRRWRALVVTAALLLVAHALTLGDWPHYTAPGTAVFYVLGILGLRHVVAWLRGRERIGGARLLPVAVATVAAILCVAQVPAQRPDPEDWSRGRQRILAELARRPGDDLVLVRAPAGVPWLANGADVDGSGRDPAAIVLAREIDPESDRRLLERYAGRRVWIVEPGPGEDGGGFVLRPYDGSRPRELGGMPPF